MVKLEHRARPNIVIIVADTFRKDCLGCYGNTTIKTPNLDAIAKESVRFDNAFPESLPTIPVRRALHTGRRAFPFREYKPVKWDIVYLPGWQPMDNGEDTVAENLVAAGYHTGFCTDTLPYFAPGFNFTRGFNQWEFIRGQQQDRWQSPYAVTREQLVKYSGKDNAAGKKEGARPSSLVVQHVANTARIHSENDTFTAQVFRWGMQFVEDNREEQPFYLFLDCFHPHEPWEAPERYYKMYADPAYHGKTIVHTHYAPADGLYTADEVKNIKAHYLGLCTEVDAWAGHFMEKLKQLGLWDTSLVVFTSDHGTNFCENPEHIIGKPQQAMYPAVMELPLLVHAPEGAFAGTARGDLVMNVDIPATVYHAAGIDVTKNGIAIDGQSLLGLLRGECWTRRDHVTSRYGNTLWYKDARVWMCFNTNGIPISVFFLDQDPRCMHNAVVDVEEELVEKVWAGILNDAGGDIPDYSTFKRTDAIGQKEIRH
nr:sulfatase [Candidatus Sigynarchaeota archaeon]